MHCLIYSKEKARESSLIFLVMSYELCLACQHSILIRVNHKLHKKPANLCFKEFLESLWYRLVMSMQPLEHSTIEEF